MTPKKFGIENSKKRRKKIDIACIVFPVLLFLSFCFFAMYSGVSKLVFSEDKIDLFTRELSQISAYFMPVDRTLAQKILILDQVVQSYLSGENVLQSKTAQIDDLWLYFIQNKEYLAKVGFENYVPMMDFLAQLYNYKEEVYQLLGKDQPFHYLVLLQNGNEKRPNGGFFGSFAFITFDGGHIKDLQIIDSYLPDYVAPNTRLPAPKWFTKAFGEPQIGFIAGNKFGFTDMDGKNLKLLFERMVGIEAQPARIQQMFSEKDRKMIKDKYVKGVFFLNSNLISQLFPGFEKKMREWQFINATIDLIRGSEQSNKKEIYIQQINDYFQSQKFTILQNLINQRVEIPAKNYLQLYLSNVSSGFQTFLKQNNLLNSYSSEKIYMRDVNYANNKSDQFMKKTAQLFDAEGNSLFTTQGDILDVSQIGGIEKGKKYRLQISYNFSVEERYIAFIRELETKYKIKLTPREEHILVIKPLLYEGETELHRWATRGMVYFPVGTEILRFEGDAKISGEFFPEFAQGAWYRISTENKYANLTENIRFKM